MTYISLYRYPIQISTVQREEQHVVNHLPNFYLNRTVNEQENVVLQKLCRLEKSVAPGGMKPAPGDTCSAKSTKNSIFLHYVRVAWRSHLCHQAIHHKKPRIGLTLIRRLEVYSKLSGSF